MKSFWVAGCLFLGCMGMPVQGAGHFVGWACGGGDAQGGILFATTNGADWSRQGVGQLPMVSLSAVCSSGTGNVWVVGDVEGECAAVYYSPDNGASWSRQGDATGLPSNVLQKVCVVQTQVVWAAGASGSVARTVNGGSTWEDVSVPGWPEPFQGVAAVDDQTAWVSGGSNVSGYCGLFQTTNGGTSWIRQTNGAVTNVDHLLGLAAVDKDHVWGIGGPEIIIYTEDGGDLWQEMYQAGFKDGNEIYVWGTNQVYAAFDSFVLWSDDNGGSWTNHSTTDYTMDISAPDGTNIWAIRNSYDGCNIYHSPDGGDSWGVQYTNTAGIRTTTLSMHWREDPPSVLYVDVGSTNPVAPYDSWTTAAETIQDAVDAAVDGDTIRVTNGVYDTGTCVTPGYSCLNRVVITNDITVQSINGPEMTLIVGAPDPFSGNNGTNAIRGVYMSAGLLSGFTITNGYTQLSGDIFYDLTGGGINMYGGSGVLSNSMITGNSANVGGGSSEGTLINCMLFSNTAGGCYSNTLINCLIFDNTTSGGGGGCFGSSLNNCTVYNNAADIGGGCYSCTLSNCIVYNNTAGSFPNWYFSSLSYSCTTPLPSGKGNITNSPQFVDAASSDFHLQSISPCIDTGSNALLSSSIDLDGIFRPLDGDDNGSAIVDMGCYELLNRSADSDGDVMPDGFESDYGLNPTDPADALGNLDGDSSDNRDEYIADTDPTNAASFFHLSVVNNLPPLLRMYFLSSSNRQYTLNGNTNLVVGNWTNIPGQGPRMGSGGLDWMEQTNTLRMGHYRIGVSVP